MIDSTSCNICSSINFSLFLTMRENLQIMKCNQCGLLQLIPRPNMNDLDNYYSERRNGVSENKIQRHKKISFKAFKYEARKIKKYKEKCGKILDVGCEFGFFLNEMKDIGWQVYGIDPSEDAIQFAQSILGSTFIAGKIEEANFPKQFFDVITLWNVLEHLQYPDVVLRQCFEYLRDDGLLFLRVPNLNFGIQLLRLQKLGLKFDVSKTGLFSHGLHLYFFDPQTISRLLNLCAFNIIDIYIGHPYLPHTIITNFSKSLLTRFTQAYLKITGSNLSPQLGVVACKK